MATTNRNRLIGAPVALCGLILLSAAFHAGVARAASTDRGVAALVLELSGTTKPPLVVHREVPAGTRIVIAPGGRLALLHYGTCSIVNFSGGTVHVTDKSLEAKEANIESSKPGPCPRVHKIALGGPASGGGIVSRLGGSAPLGGGIVSRGMGIGAGEDAEIASDGLVVIKGPHAAEVASVDLLDGNHNLVDGGIAIENQSFRLNGKLPPRRPYYISINFAGKREPAEVPIAISQPNTKGLLILRLE